MRSIFTVPSLLTIILSSFLVCIAIARLDPKDVDNRNIHHDTTERPPTKYHCRGDDPDSENWALGKFQGDFSNSEGVETSLGTEYTGCAVNGISPTYEDVIAVADKIAKKLSCYPDSNARCTLIGTYSSAKIYLCGDPAVKITCSQLAGIVKTLSGDCSKLVDGEFKVRGTTSIISGTDSSGDPKVSFVTVVAANDHGLDELTR